MNKKRMGLVGLCFVAAVSMVGIACGGEVQTGPKGDSVQGPPGDSVAGAAGSSGSDGTNGKNGSDGTNGTDGTNGSNGTNGEAGSPGTDGVNGTNGSNGTNGLNGKDGETGLTGSQGDAGSSLCGDQLMPEWHTACGADLVGSCASSTLRWECHARVVSENGDVEQFKVCADATTHAVVAVGSAQSTEYPNNPVATTSNRCDQDADCDGVADRLTDTVSSSDSNTVTVSVGDVVSLSGGHSDGSTQCLSGVATCDTSCGRIKVSFATVSGSDTLGKDCFNSSTTLEQTMGCTNSAGAWVSPDYDQDGDDPWCEDEANLWIGAASVSCVAPHADDTHACSSP